MRTRGWDPNGTGLEHAKRLVSPSIRPVALKDGKKLPPVIDML